MTEEQAKWLARNTWPQTRDWLWNWVYGYTGVNVARNAVCEGHSAPFDMFAQQVLVRPPLTLWHGPRGSGKSYLSAIDTHINSRFNARHETRILGGSKAQAAQIHAAINRAIIYGSGHLGSDSDAISDFQKESAIYANGSKVSILAASATSVRGPHVPSLKLDEVDEIDTDLREAAMGMAMDIGGQRTSVLMTSTWHKPSGPMTELIDKGRDGAFPVHTYCIFEVLERCPDDLSGPHLERCGVCPLVTWCHADRDRHPSGLPKAKRSSGHYTIRSLIQKVVAISERALKSDYLCQGPQVDGTWFSKFDEAQNVAPLADYRDFRGPVFVSVDSGVWTGAIFSQFSDMLGIRTLSIFDEYLSYDVGAGVAAREILAILQARCPRAPRRVSTDSAGGSANPSGVTVFAEYELAGLKGELGLETWPKYPGCIVDGLQLVEAWVRSASGVCRILIHPRCRKLIQAFQAYHRKKVQGQWLEVPENPQHPHEDLIDPVRGLLKLMFPESNRPKAQHYRSVPARQIF